MEGRLSVSSEEGKGSVFVVDLPVMRSREAAVAQTAQAGTLS
jgi:signal transduction histidine kinase